MTKPSLHDKNILITSGPTRAYIDSVRYISNTSSGRLGSEIAAECVRRGAEVRFLFGRQSLTPASLAASGEMVLEPDQLDRLYQREVATVFDLPGMLDEELKGRSIDWAVMAMAVLDYAPPPDAQESGKQPSGQECWQVELRPTPKIIDRIKKISPHTRVVGFKLEVAVDEEHLMKSARSQMERTGAELVVANDLALIEECGYRALLLEMDDSGRLLSTDLRGRHQAAGKLCDRLAQE
jgi:phosphopantothenoylcysteine synthetase/decarboxylase